LLHCSIIVFLSTVVTGKPNPGRGKALRLGMHFGPVYWGDHDERALVEVSDH
jgi:hypothetical protein